MALPEQTVPTNPPEARITQIIVWGSLLFFLAVYLIWVIWVGGSRNVLGYGTETDFLGGFVPEARRFLNGEPLASRYHPPLYSILLATIFLLVDDWMYAGLIISALSGFCAIIISFMLFKLLFGPSYGVGAVIGLMAAPGFLSYSITASSDLMFTSIFLGACAFMIAACQTEKIGLFVVAGVLIGFGVLTRTNGITLLVLVLFPFIIKGPARLNLYHTVITVTSLLIVLMVMIIFSITSESSIFPRGTVDNLAMTFFSDRGPRYGSEALEQVHGRFDSIFDVLMHDPFHVAKLYLLDMAKLILRRFPNLVESPISLLFLPGLIIILIYNLGRFSFAILIALAAQILLLGLKPFDGRFYIFIVPCIGVGLTLSVILISRAHKVKRIFIIMMAIIIITGISQAGIKGARQIMSNEREIALVVSSGAPSKLPPNSLVVARKPHFAFYAGVNHAGIPNVSDLAALREEISGFEREGPMFLFFGEVEAIKRPELSGLRDPLNAPFWLKLVQASGKDSGKWALYRVIIDPVGD